MKSLMLLWCVLAGELGKHCCTSTDLDIKYVETRFEAEGLAFLTLTLPQFGKDFERGLELGEIHSLEFPSFGKSGSIPRFLSGFVSQVFDKASGCLIDDPSWECIKAIRQLTLLFAKIHLDCSEERTRGALEKYIGVDQQVRLHDALITEEELEDLHSMSSLLYSDVFEIMDDKVMIGDIYCSHGSGATADRLMGNQKFDNSVYHERLHEMFPFGDHLQPSRRFDELFARAVLLKSGAERPVKVVTVPKTQKTPRVIAEEPTCMMYVQQGISKELVQLLERDQTLSGMIGFLDQTPNQRLAREGSLNGDLATLDLSEASDRVSYEHVRVMLQDFPFFWKGVDAARSQKAQVLDKVIDLAKFASMGSALCFPMEAMVFLAVIFLGIQDELGRPLTRKLIRQFHGKVRVYGDDIIVPVNFVQSVIRRLEAFGFVVNMDKSFWNGKFRESCGKEYFAGHDVSISRVRRVFPTSRTDVLEIVSLVSLRNQLYVGGRFETADYLDGIIAPLLTRKGKVHYPIIEMDESQVSFTGDVTQRSGVLGRFDLSGAFPEKIDADTHAPMVKGFMVKSLLPLNQASGEGALLKYFLKRSDLPFADREHLERSGRPKPSDFKLRLGWSKL